MKYGIGAWCLVVLLIGRIAVFSAEEGKLVERASNVVNKIVLEPSLLRGMAFTCGQGVYGVTKLDEVHAVNGNIEATIDSKGRLRDFMLTEGACLKRSNVPRIIKAESIMHMITNSSPDVGLTGLVVAVDSNDVKSALVSYAVTRQQDGVAFRGEEATVIAVDGEVTSVRDTIDWDRGDGIARSDFKLQQSVAQKQAEKIAVDFFMGKDSPYGKVPEPEKMRVHQIGRVEKAYLHVVKPNESWHFYSTKYKEGEVVPAFVFRYVLTRKKEYLAPGELAVPSFAAPVIIDARNGELVMIEY